jgi:predicted nucleic acid-binding protein
MTRGSSVFLDTNILLSASDRARTSHLPCSTIVRKAIEAGVTLCVSGQVLREYLVVATRPASQNGFGLPVSDALHNLSRFRARVSVLDESTDVARELARLVQAYSITGKRIHDANLVATMSVHGVDELVTENGDDFGVFQSITIVSPEDAATMMG